jgi:protein Jumonji
MPEDSSPTSSGSRVDAFRPSIYQSRKQQRPPEKHFIKSKNSSTLPAVAAAAAGGGTAASKPVTQYNIVDDKSSPYAFDFDSTESPQVPFRKSSSPLKPPAMIKKSKSAQSCSTLPPSQRPPPDDPTGGRRQLASPKQQTPARASSKVTAQTDKKKNPTATLSVDLVSRQEEVGVLGGSGGGSRTDPAEDASSSDNETTYFIPLQTSGQSFGVAVKLGTDGPSGPNQKVIMTAKLVTHPGKKPMKAKILGSKTVESSSSSSGEGRDATAAADAALVINTGGRSPVKEPLTPRKVRMPAASSPLSPSYPKDSTISPIADRPRARMRRALSPASHPPTAPSASTPVSAAGGRGNGKKRPMCLIGNVVTGPRFPRLGQHAQLMEAPTFRPTDAEFRDPLRYIQKIRQHAEPFGMCRIIPPRSFKPDCNLDDDMRFTAYNQYINRMLSRWGPNAKETAAIKKYLDTQNVDTRSHPLVGGLEVDLPALYHAVQNFGGLSEVIQKKKWGKIAEYLRIARGTHASGNKLDDIYVKWLLPYDTLSSVEREELLRLVEEEWAEQSRERGSRGARGRAEGGVSGEEEEEDDEDDEDEQDAVVKGG